MSANFKRRWTGIQLLAAAVLSCAYGLPAAQAAIVGKPFAIKKFTMETTSPTKEIAVPGGSEFVNEPYAFTQAGGHPWALTTKIEFESEEAERIIDKERVLVPTRDPKDIVVDLPPGLLGDPMALPSCPLTIVHAGGRCPAATQVGVYRVRWQVGKEELAPIVNVTPEAGQTAEFALENEVNITPVLTAHLVRTDQGYGFDVESNEIPEVEVLSIETTFWGVPADPSHDAMRGLFCGKVAQMQSLNCSVGTGKESSGVLPVPFLTMGTNCSAGPEIATIRADSWQEPGFVGVNGQYSEQYRQKTATMPGVTGCNLLQFSPTINTAPDTLLADEPVGLGVTLNVPVNEKPDTNATPQLRDSLITLPEGLSIGPGVVDGIEACDEFGPNGINITGPESEEVSLTGELQLAAGHCPDASIVGTAEAITPFLPAPIKGHVYLARPGCGGVRQRTCTEEDARDGNLYRLYLELGGTGLLAKTGVHFKVALETEANTATGQLTTRATGTPQAPFSELKIQLNGGPRAPLDNPAACGRAVTTSDFTPWSAQGTTPQGITMLGTPDATPSSFFNVIGCTGSPGLSPAFQAGTVNPRAGQFSPFTLNLSRQDREQYVKGIQVHTPPGLLGMLSNVPLCGEVQANAGTCPAQSKIGTTRVATGAGSHPFEIEGNVYLTGRYRGAPFVLSIATSAVAGPVNLGTVVVRAQIHVDPTDSTLTVTTDEDGPYAVPQLIFGIPLRLQRVRVNIDRPNFMFNPTSCAAQQVEAAIAGSEDAKAMVASRFASSGCKGLAFKPAFKVSVSGRTSRANGAGLDAKLSYPKDAFGNDANIAKVKVSLPKQLPSRLTTLQRACPAATFTSNPGLCPRESIVGIARASTPLLPVGLAGPVFFVSHGGEAFPSLIVVLQGYGVRVDLTGTTFISKRGITSSTFKMVPDVPVKTFELYLPQGRYSALAANGDLCKARAKLVMPTTFIAHNGAQMKQSTKLAVAGCKAAGAKASRWKLPRHSARRRQQTVGRVTINAAQGRVDR
jgi:hypothetical protein